MKLRTLFTLLGMFLAQSASGAGVTIITHDFQLTSLDHDLGWVEAMGDHVVDRAGGTSTRGTGPFRAGPARHFSRRH